MPPPVHGSAMVGKYIHDSELINTKFDCHYINLTTASDLEDVGKFRIKKVFSFYQLLRKIRKSLIDTKPQLVYVTPNSKGGPFYKDFIVVMMMKMMGCKIVAHYHNKGVSIRQNRWIDNLLYRMFFKGLKVILLGEPLYLDVKKYVKREDVYICPNGIPEDDTKNEDTPHRISKILFLSNLLIDKGVLVLLDALKMLKEKDVVFSCDIVGGETAVIDAVRFDKEIKKRNLEDCVSYRGKQYGINKNVYLKNADVFVHPTNDDCFPLVLLEAMQHGLPILTTNEGAISDIVDDGKTGLIARKNNPNDLADKIELLLNDENLRKKFGEAGRNKYKQEYTLVIFEKRLSDILHSLTKS